MARALAAALVLSVLFAGGSGAASGGWTNPRLVGRAGDCNDVTATVDDAGRFHVVAQCGSGIRYADMNADGSWTSVDLDHPIGHTDLNPQVAVDGNRLYVAYTQSGPGGCGGGPEVGVFYRWRTLPSGAWSGAVQLGPSSDALQSFRVAAGAIHATVTDERTGRIYYERWDGTREQRYLLSGAILGTSLRVGSDGRARIAYQSLTALRYAVFTGSGFSTSSIPGTSIRDQNPQLVLDASNAAHIVWSHESLPGCVAGPPDSANGTYYATNAGGTWTPAGQRRITTALGATSLVVDVATGRVHVLLSGDFGVRYYTKPATGPWSSATRTRNAAWSGAIRLDQASGALLAVFTRAPSTHISASIYAMTRP